MSRWPLLRDCFSATWNMLRMPGWSFKGPLPPEDAEIASTASELREDISKLSEEIGERNVSNRPGNLSLAGDYIESALQHTGHRTSAQEYRVTGVVCRNLELEIPGTSRPDEIIVVGAHYDSVVGCPAANDNGSGVAAMLALARRLSRLQVERTVRFVGFVNEEEPYAHTDRMGSRVYARRCRERGENIVGMLSLETIGCYRDARGTQSYPPLIGLLYPSRGNFIGFVGNTRHGPFVRDVVRAFRQSEPFPSEGAALPESISDIARSDHWSFWQEGYPALMVTDTAEFRYPYYHTPEDTLDKLDLPRTSRVLRGLHGVIASLATTT